MGPYLFPLRMLFKPLFKRFLDKLSKSSCKETTAEEFRSY